MDCAGGGHGYDDAGFIAGRRDRVWTDADLYKKYDLTADEVSFIEQMIRPMGAGRE